MFSIIIPTYNNINYLKLCLASIKKNSSYDHEIIIHINEGGDGTKIFLDSSDYKTTYSKKILEFVWLLTKLLKKLQKNI